VLPENVPAVDLFLGVQTQWRAGFGGATVLDYAGVQVLEMSYLEASGDKAQTAASAPAETSRARVNVRRGRR
jgi:hypothetical protein